MSVRNSLIAVACLLGGLALSIYTFAREEYSRSCNGLPHSLLPYLVGSSALLGVEVVSVISRRRVLSVVAILSLTLIPSAPLLVAWYRFAHDMVSCGN